MAKKARKAKRTGKAKRAPKKETTIEVGVAEVVDYLRVTGVFAPALMEVVGRKVTAQAARRSGIRVTTRQLQRAADAFRLSNNLNKAKDTKAWMAANGVTIEALEEYLETNLLVAAFKDRLAAKAPRGKYAASQRVKGCIRDLAHADWLRKALS